MIVFLLAMLIGLSLLIFWQGSLLYASIFTVPTVYANDQAILDAFKLADLKKGELLIDLGCGNAKSLILAAREHGARGIGVENSLYCYLKSRWNVYRSGHRKNIRIVFGDFRKVEKELHDCDMVYMYLLNKVLTKIEPWFFNCIGLKTRAVVLCFWFPNIKPVKQSKTFNLGKEADLRLFLKPKTLDK